MAILTQAEVANQMIQQLRILDPSVSAAVGTPERKIIDTVAQAITDAQVDLTALQGALDIDTKFGSDLDKFMAVFNFARQNGTTSTGVVTLGRTEPSNLDIRVPIGTQLTATVPSSAGDQILIFVTTADAYLLAGSTSVQAPIRAAQSGSSYNIAANSITGFVGETVLGITSVTNPVPTVGGVDTETDAELKVRFKNTLFRNLAGTSDQFLALAVAGLFTNKANVIGPISRYREFIQIPRVDDSMGGGGGTAGYYTTAPSTVPYSKHTYPDIPTFLSNGQSGLEEIFYNEGLDFDTNSPPTDVGDTKRLGGGETPDATRPNVTAYNVYTGDDASVQAIRPNDVVMHEHSYLSSASRNDIENNVTNCVDVFANGTNQASAVTTIPLPEAGTHVFVNGFHWLHYDFYRRGRSEARPLVGSIFSPLYWTPLVSLPPEIVVGNVTYYEGIHYWPVYDASDLGGSVRARTGIEWHADARGQLPTDDEGVYSGPHITANSATSVEINNYTFNRNVIDLQVALEGAKQVTTDVLVHQAKTRYFKFLVDVMYEAGANVASVNQNISSALGDFLDGKYFGSLIQLSDVLQVIHSVTGVDNVRWSTDLGFFATRVVETDENGMPLSGAVVDRLTWGSVSPNVVEEQQWYFPVANHESLARVYYISYEGTLAGPFNSDMSAATIETILQSDLGDGDISVSGSGTGADPFILTWGATDYGLKDLIQITTTNYGSEASFNDDFFLRDNELPSIPLGLGSTTASSGETTPDTAPGLSITIRAQNTW